MKYEVVWHGKSFEFDDYCEAIECAKEMTFEEEKFDTALMFIRSEDEVKIQGIRWIIFGMYEIVNIII